MSTQSKKWYYNQNSKSQGPFTFSEIQSKIRQGVITQKTSMWYTGIPAWVSAEEIDELRSSFKKQTAEDDGFSALNELRPHEVDDRTGQIDRASLAQAKKEAARIHNVARKARKKFVKNHGKESKLFLKGVGILLLIGGGYAATQLNLFSNSSFSWLDRVISPLPTLSDISSEDYSLLKTAAQTSLTNEGPKVAIALSSSNLVRPVFVLASNLPDGTTFSGHLHADLSTLLVEKFDDINFPLTLSGKIAKSNALHTPENTDIPIGDYELTLTEDNDQPPAVQTILASLPVPPTSTAAAPAAQGKKIIIIQRVFLGGEKSPDYLAKLDQYRQSNSRKIVQDPQK